MFSGYTIQDEDDDDKLLATTAASSSEKALKIQTVDNFNSLQLNSQADVDDLIKKCAEKLEGKCRGAAGQFLVKLIKEFSKDLTTEFLTKLDKSLTETSRDLKMSKSENIAK